MSIYADDLFPTIRCGQCRRPLPVGDPSRWPTYVTCSTCNHIWFVEMWEGAPRITINWRVAEIVDIPAIPPGHTVHTQRVERLDDVIVDMTGDDEESIDPTAIIGASPVMFPFRPNSRERFREKVDEIRPTIGDGCHIFAHVIIVNGTKRPTDIGDRVVLAHRAHIGHDACIGDDSLIGVGAIVCGFVTIGQRCTIGAGAIICPEVNIHDDCFIGAGVVVSKDVMPNTKLTAKGKRCNWSDLPW